MKLTIILLTVAFLNVSASGVSQNVSYTGKGMPLEKIFFEIQRQTGFNVLYQETTLAGMKPVSISVEKLPLPAFLDLLLSDLPIKYVIDSKSILLSRKKATTGIVPLSGLLSDYLLPLRIRVLDSTGAFLSGASVSVKNSRTSGVTDAEGVVNVNVKEGDVLIVSFIGMENRFITITKSILSNSVLSITLLPSVTKLEEVEVVVNTGYQTLPKERVTGSFVQINKELYNRQVGPDILQRLESITSGLLFNRMEYGKNPISIRGWSSIFSSTMPLIIVDGFPFEGELNTLNPNDVEGVTVLKDAAAASIWGARAGNGVIVIETKKGGFNRKPHMSLSSNVTINQKPDLTAAPRISTSDYIDLESRFFELGYFDNAINNPISALNPLVEILRQHREHLITSGEASSQIDAFRHLDVRNDMMKYMMRNSVQQQYSFSVDGGGKDVGYYISGGFDKNQPVEIGNHNQRITLNAKTICRPVKNLEVNAGLNYIQTVQKQSPASYETIGSNFTYDPYPYMRLADERGQPVPINFAYRRSYVDTVGGGKLLDWHYYPLDEARKESRTTHSYDIRLNLDLKYQLFPSFSLEGKYQYLRSFSDQRDLQGLDEWQVRDDINRFTQVLPDGTLQYPYPMGGTLFLLDQNKYASSIRGQVNFNKGWNKGIHALNAIGGVERNETVMKSHSDKLLGYDDEYGTNMSVLYNTPFQDYSNPNSYNYIYSSSGVSGTTDRFFSYFANASYTFDHKLSVTVSGRKDASNLFGVRTNQKGVPLWSAGLSWTISQESFYKVDWLPYLKARLTYGFNGNVDRGATALLTAGYTTAPLTNLQAAYIDNPPNKDLVWERVRVINGGIDFGIKNQILTGSLEYYIKEGLDLMGAAQVVPSAGVARMNMRRNVATTRGYGVDLTLHSKNIQGKFSWETNLIASYTHGKVTSYSEQAFPYQYLSSGQAGTYNGPLPVVGKPLYAMYGIRWAGLDPQNGDPLVYYQGKPGKEYQSLLNTVHEEDVLYYGDVIPTVYGALRNDFSWKGFSLSANITFKGRYYFRRPSFSGWSGTGDIPHSDYALRWQKPGDELNTQVPAQEYQLPFDYNRNSMYPRADILIEKGDYVRLQDIKLGFDFARMKKKVLPFTGAQLYMYVTDLGILWRANKAGLDPEHLSIPASRTLSVGCKLNW